MAVLHAVAVDRTQLFAGCQTYSSIPTATIESGPVLLRGGNCLGTVHSWFWPVLSTPSEHPCPDPACCPQYHTVLHLWYPGQISRSLCAGYGCERPLYLCAAP